MSRFLDPKLSCLKAYTPGEQPRGIKNLIKLNTNENTFPPSPKVIKAVNEAAVSDLRLYPDPTCLGLIDAIAKNYKVSSSQVFTANGSDETLAFCFHGLCPNGAAFADITYGFYPVFTEMFGVKSEIVPLREDFSIAPEDYANIRGTVFIANPNAPTGLCLSLPQIEQLLLQNSDRLVIIDEAYIDFGGESAVSLLGKYDNLLVIQTYSKSRQLAGGRLSFALGSQQLISDMNTMKFSFNPYSVNRIALFAGEAAMRDTEYFEACRRVIIQNREYTTKALRELGFTVLDSKANFVFASPFGISGEDYYAALRERGILVRYFNMERISNYVRITIGSSDQMSALISATKEILEKRGLSCAKQR